MKILKNSLGLGTALFLLACGQTNSNTSGSAIDTSKVVTTENPVEKSYPVAMVDNKKDPSCGMPVTAGIHDTTHYENHVLGFCSAECKKEFLKNPKAGLAAAELK